MVALNGAPDARLRIELLGSVQVWHGRRELVPGPPLRQAVLAVLAPRANRTVSRDEIINAVWGDTPPASAANNVQIYVGAIRRILASGCDDGAAMAQMLRGGRSGYLLRLEPGQLDVAAFDDHLRRARACLVGGDPATAVSALDAALALWRGTPLSNVAGPFADAQRLRPGERRLAALEDRAEAVLALGRSGGGDLVAELADDHPLRERLRGLLMRALHRDGRRAEALTVYAATRRLLVDELGIEPGPQLQEVHQAILADDEPPSRPYVRRRSHHRRPGGVLLVVPRPQCRRGPAVPAVRPAPRTRHLCPRRRRPRCPAREAGAPAAGRIGPHEPDHRTRPRPVHPPRPAARLRHRTGPHPVTTLDVLTGGRAWLGIGAGYHGAEAQALGLPLPPPAERFERLEETLQIATRMWVGDEAAFEGRHYRLTHPQDSPGPVQRPHPPILIGGAGERRTLRLVARYADACNLFDIPDGGRTVRHKLAVLARHCADVGRPYNAIEKSLSTRLDPGESSDEFVRRCTAAAAIGIEHVAVITAGAWTSEALATLAAAISVLRTVRPP